MTDDYSYPAVRFALAVTLWLMPFVVAIVAAALVAELVRQR